MSEKNRPLEVSELTEYIKLLIGSDEFLGSVTVRGELSNYKVYPSGHHYFTMKDATSSVRCVMFKSAAQKLRFTPESGMKMIAFGRIEVYLRDGAYQFYVTDMTPDGVGDLYVEFERLKEKLRLEGLFDEARKRPLPRFPRTIAVVTSSAGAAVRDIIRILGARWSAAKVVVLPVRVQGEEAPREIVSALRYCNRHNVADVIITG
ncbi:MAG: exodeoxyribonuclease VII large subunit, partial [Oscillospiraceae bacterium]|nr:exodeoxyribonuclease VII large subunit [Oscillospiraceae bacterium]